MFIYIWIMSPRPRSISDKQILEAAERALQQIGPASLSLADIGREAGLAPATLLQRFGSKRNLLLRLLEREDEVKGRTLEARTRSRTTLGAVFRLLEGLADRAQTAEGLAHRLAFLQMDLSDTEFRQRALQQARATRSALRELLNEAVAHGELRPCNTRQLAKAAHAIAGGALALWAVHREGQARRAVRTSLTTLLDPYRRRKRRRTKRIARRRKAR